MPGRLARGGRGRAGYLLADRRCARPPAGRRSLGTLSSRWPSRPRGDPASLRVRATFGRPGGLRRLKRRFHKEMYFLLTINNRNRRFGRPGGLRRPCRRVIAQGLVADLAVMISLCQDDRRGMRSSQVSAGGGMTPGWQVSEGGAGAGKRRRRGLPSGAGRLPHGRKVALRSDGSVGLSPAAPAAATTASTATLALVRIR